MLPNYFSTYCEKCGEYYRLNNCKVLTMDEALPDCEYDEESGSLTFLPGGYDEVTYVICPNGHKNEARKENGIGYAGCNK